MQRSEDLDLARWKEEDRIERRVLNELLNHLDQAQNGGRNEFVSLTRDSFHFVDISFFSFFLL